MKKMFLMLCLAAVPALAMISCSDDKGNDPTLAESVQGTYPVGVGVDIGEGYAQAIDASVVAVPAGNDKIDVSLKDFSMDGGATTIPIELKGLQLSGANGNVNVSYTGKINVPNLGLNNLDGTVSGTIKGGVMDLQLTVVATPLTVKVKIGARTLANSAQGVYPVDIVVPMLGSTPLDAKVVVTAQSNDKINMELQGFKLDPSGESIPISLSGLTLTGTPGNAVVSYDGAITAAALEALGNLSGTVAGTIKGTVMDLTLVIKVADKNTGVVGLTVDVEIDSKTE